ncbi:hypothetical protein EUGRSUZ_G00486 [Eucalyptus grandis]|uniref:Uncharacterized protein n=2 Tax=Eucalyptus grandis TaxID=71139 RepID=A0ACC3K4G6_EUCGR|nr:hypothetical protein EUGRSUZ_G00486 [Eucalyptus grandis]
MLTWRFSDKACTFTTQSFDCSHPRPISWCRTWWELDTISSDPPLTKLCPSFSPDETLSFLLLELKLLSSTALALTASKQSSLKESGTRDMERGNRK